MRIAAQEQEFGPLDSVQTVHQLQRQIEMIPRLIGRGGRQRPFAGESQVAARAAGICVCAGFAPEDLPLALIVESFPAIDYK